MMRRQVALDANVELPQQMQRSPRRRVVLKGMLQSVGGTQQVSVRNLSSTGAMVEGTTVPVAGREAILRAGKLDCFCRIVWSDGTKCGLEFDEPIPMADVLALHQVTAEAVRHLEEAEAADWFLNQGRFARM